MNSKKWVKIFIVSSFLMYVISGMINYIVDPFNIFHTKILKHQFQMNERFMKIEFLEKNYKDFNGYMFGSSRIGTTAPSIIEKYIPNSNFYNFTISSANFYDYLMYLKYFIKRKYPINTLYLQIDIEDMSFYGHAPSDYLRKPHPHVTGESLGQYYLEYMINFFPFNTKGKIAKNINYTDRTNYFLNTGIWTKPDKKLDIQNNCRKYVSSVSAFNNIQKRVVRYTTSTDSMEALAEIKKLCRDNNIKLYIFTTPHNKIMMDKFIIYDYLKFIKQISKITEFYDFSGYNTITTNNCNYYEISHYRPTIGKIIAGRIFNDKSIEVPNDFGVLVTKNNIDEHLKNLKDQIESHVLNKTFK